MRSVGAYEARTRLAQLLDRVAQGERITITRYGVAVAVLSRAEPTKSATVDQTIRALQRFRRKHRLGDIPLRRWIEEGRRY
jgi:prevent-host-death family protein